jgi:hypothetical protein
MPIIDVTVSGPTASGKSTVALLLQQRLAELNIPVDLHSVDRQLEQDPTLRAADLVSRGAQVTITERNIPIPPKGAPSASETPLQTFIRLFIEAMGEFEEAEKFDLTATDAGSVAEQAALTARVNDAIHNLHAFLHRHPVGAIKL